MKRLVSVLSILAVAGLIFVQAAQAAEKKTHEMTATVVSIDMDAKTITIKDDKGEKTAPVLPEALGSLKSIKAGEMVVLTCLDNDKGEHQGVTAIKAAPAKK
jgi:ABC-type enterochelin transport system substrate-binding protein